MHDYSRTQDRYGYSNKTVTNPMIISSWKHNNSDHHHQDVLQFRPNPHETSMESDDSGANSPPLWKDIAPTSPSSQPLLSHRSNGHGSLSPDSRTQAIIRGQWELMEMVKNMPESSYELSLKDLVEHNRSENQEQPHQSAGFSRFSGDNDHRNLKGRGGGTGGVLKLKSKRHADQMRKWTFENKGLFLNVVSPFFSVRSKNSVSGGGYGGAEKDWWKKKMSGSTDSDDSSRMSNNFNSSSNGSSGSSSSSNRSCTSNSRKRNGFLTSCLPFFRSRKAGLHSREKEREISCHRYN